MKKQRGSVWWMTIPHDKNTPHIQSGDRPVIIISNRYNNEYSSIVEVCPITTKKDEYDMIHPKIIVDGTVSYVLTEQIRTVPKSMLQNYICDIRYPEMISVDKALLTQLGLSKYLHAFEKLERCNSDKKQIDPNASVGVEETKEDLSLARATELGQHVLSILNLLGLDRAQQSDTSPSSTPTAKATIVFDSDNVGSSIDEELQRESDKIFVPPTPSSLENLITQFNPPRPQASKPNRYNQVAKFEARRAKTAALQTQNKEVNACTNHATAAKPRATKWTSDKINQFISDYTELPVDVLLNKYGLTSAATANKYYRVFKKAQSS